MRFCVLLCALGALIPGCKLGAREPAQAKPAASTAPAAEPLRFRGTRELVHDEGLAAGVDALAATGRYETAGVGFAGTPSTVYARFNDLRGIASPDVVAALLMHEAPVVRVYMAEQVARTRGDVHLLLPLLRDRSRIATVQGCISGESTVADRVAQELRSAAVQNDGRAVLDVLPNAVRDEHNDPSARATLLAELAAQKHPQASALALRVLDAPDAPDAQLVAAAIAAVEQSRAGADMARVVKLTSDRRPEVRVAAARACGAHPSDAARDALVPLLTDPDRRVREFAGPAYAKQSGLDLVMFESVLMRAGSEGYYLDELAQRDPNARVVGMMRNLLGSADETTRRTAIRFLVRAGERDIAPRIRPMLETDDILEITSATEALAQLDDRASIPQLEALLTNPNLHAAIAAARALVQMNAQSSLPAFDRAIARGPAQFGIDGPFAIGELKKLAAQLRSRAAAAP